MVTEHENIITDINLLLTDILQHDKSQKYTVKYIEDELGHGLVEVFVLGDGLSAKDSVRFMNTIKKSDVVTDIYTLEMRKLYLMRLMSIENIRTHKINKLQKKITQ